MCVSVARGSGGTAMAPAKSTTTESACPFLNVMLYKNTHRIDDDIGNCAEVKPKHVSDSNLAGAAGTISENPGHMHRV